MQVCVCVCACCQGFGIHHALNPDPYRGVFGNDGHAYAQDVKDLIQAATPGKVGVDRHTHTHTRARADTRIHKHTRVEQERIARSTMRMHRSMRTHARMAFSGQF